MKKSLFESSGDYLLFITIILLFIGSVNIFSASFVMADQQFGNSYHFVIRHLISVGAGTVAAAILYRLDYRRIVHLFPFWLPFVGLLLILVILFGIEVNGARRWLGPFFGFQVQPSEFAKIAVIMLGAWYSSLCYRRKRSPTFLHWSTGIALLFFGLIHLQPDFGTGLLMMSFFAVTLLLGGVSTKEIIAVGILGVAGLGVIAVQAPYRLARLTNWWNPWEAQTAGGYQAVQSFLAIGSGGWLGMGGGQGISKFYYLPEAHTDFAFSVLAQEWGFAGVAVVFLLFLSLLLAGIRIAWKAVDAMGFCLAGGLTLFIVLQAFGNGMMVSGILPVTGIPMPFFSYGGTFMLTNLIAVGLLLSIWRVSEEASIRREERAERHQEASESGEEY